MAVDRLLPVSTTPGAITGDSYMDAVQEEVTGLWNTGTVLTLSAVSGTNTITATLTPALTAGLADGMNFILRAAATNTSTVTLSINGGGAVAVVDGEGTALTAGAIRSGGHYLLNYNSGSTHLRIVGYTPAANVVVGSKLLRTQAASPSASLDFVHGASGVVLDDTYDAYELVCSSLVPATDDVELWFRVGTGGGPTYQTANYHHVYSAETSAGGTTTNNSTSNSRIIIAGGSGAGQGVGNAAGENVSATIRFHNPESTTLRMLVTAFGPLWQANDSCTLFRAGGAYQTGAAITAVRIMFESGNITSGRVSLYGITKA
jgi:hypothetical protein